MNQPSPEWIQAARYYSSLDDAARAAYWSTLTSEQQAALRVALAAGAPAAPAAPAPTLQATPETSGCGCGAFLRRGCLVTLLTIAALTLWSRLPAFWRQPGDRYALWPESTSKVTAIRETGKLAALDPSEARGFFFPAALQVPDWMTAAHLQPGDIAELVLLRTDYDPQVSLNHTDVKLDLRRSFAAIFTLRAPRPNLLLETRPASGRQVQFNDVTAIAIPNPSGGSSLEPWYWTMPDPTTLVVAGEAATREILALSRGEQTGLSGRAVLRPLLQEVQDSVFIDMDVIPPAWQSWNKFWGGVANIVTGLPGVSLLFSARAQVTALDRNTDGSCTQILGYQFSERAAGMGLRAFFSLVSPADWSFSGSKQSIPSEATVKGSGGLVLVQMHYSPEQCKAAIERSAKEAATPGVAADARRHR